MDAMGDIWKQQKTRLAVIEEYMEQSLHIGS